ncbi:MAG: hypothetical protein K5930_10870 [Treponemataceae bacterium]|nr:hypothetical protein [Treponemataceae bacterium]
MTLASGRYGYDSYMLSEQTIHPDSSTDLLLSFENGRVVDEAGFYSIDSADVFIGDNSARGEKAALSRGETSGIRLTGNPASVFGRQGLTGSFTIEFWMCPLASGNGELIFTWHSSRNLESYSLYQSIAASVYGSKMVWNFTNVFDTMSEENSSYSLNGVSILIPGTWSHHELSFDENTGMVEYKMNGVTEDVLFVTSTGYERGTVYEAHLGVPASLNICPSYTGWIDNFCIRRDSSSNESVPFLYPYEGGRFETGLFSLGKNGAEILSIDALSTVPDETWVEYYVRASDSPFDWTETQPEWKVFIPGQDLSDLGGVWFQLAADLYTDGACSISPSVSEFTIKFEEYGLPVTPYNLKAVAGDGYVDLSWDGTIGNSRSNTAGYILYYGKRPGEYLGNDAAEGSSPIYVGDKERIRITGLDNGRIYYFAVAGVSSSSPELIGPLSSEVYARPLHRQLKN